MLTTAQQITKLLLDLFEKIDDETNDLKKRVILGHIEEYGKVILKQGSAPEPEPPEPPEPQPEPALCSNCDRPIKDHSAEERQKCNITTPTPQPQPSSVITEESVLEFCKELLTDKKLTISEIKEKFEENAEFGIKNRTVWWPIITNAVMNDKISLIL